ncbi:MAG TPA: hypothetical protein VGN69_02550 [Solirubrobacteraceae bacterium]|nr:hypothetical protein [Solirubrobacteraceae bacterium]
MRWQNLSIEEEQGTRLPGYRDPAVVRRFDAPEALDVRFYEVRARSALNRVPAASRMPFRWTVNPYRGCTHACVYCLAGETRVLMADGGERPLSELQVGDAIFGTRLQSGRRRYVVGEVLDTWSETKAAVRVTLQDGTTLVASAGHRFLTGGGWRRVEAAGGAQDDALSDDSVLAGPGRFAPAERRQALGGQLVSAGQDLRVRSVQPLGHELELHDITTTTGDFIAEGVVSHNCFARPTHKYLDLDAGRDFEREIVVKVNAPELLRAELSRPSWGREHVAMGTNTDPYQWVEGRYRLMPGIWEALRDTRTPCSVLTKSPLLLRDLDLLRDVARHTEVSASLSIPTLDQRAWRATEPHTPNPLARMEAVAELNRAGIPTGILVAPLMPGINDSPEQVQRILDLAVEAGATGVGGIALHLRGEVRAIFMDWLRHQRPDLVDHYQQLYARGAYAPAAERQRLSRLVSGTSGAAPPRMRWRARVQPGSLSAPAPPARAAAQERLF